MKFEIKMLQTELIQDFLSREVIAVVGLSRKGDLPANFIFKKFVDAGYETYPVNPNAEEIDGVQCYPNVKAVPKTPDAVFLGGTPKVSENTIEDCVEAKVPIVWMHRGIGKGSFSEKAAELCENNGIKAVTNGCPMMFIQSVDPFHKLLRWFKSW